MKITYTGRKVELAPAELKKLEARFAKIGKLLDGKREAETHVILSLERHLHQAEATVNYYGHQLAGEGSSTDLFTAIHSAAEKLEKQAVKSRTKWRDNRRAPHETASEAEAEAAPPEVDVETEEEAAAAPAPHVHRVDHHKKRKPMTIEEAMMDMEKREYVVYRDAATDRLSVLLRRRDGNFDLIEA